MRRAILTLGSTAAGLAALLSFKTHTSVADVADSGAGSPTVSASAAGTRAASVAPTKARAKAKMSSTASPRAKASAGASTGSGGSMAARTITGPVESTMYGPVQVKVTLDGQKITNVSMVQDTNDGQESQQIDSFAIPKLTAETLTAQSARIDAVSGATTTSTGYVGSLQSALDQAGA